MDIELEKAIDETGRDRVFQRAREIGWTNSAPPAWVWWGIVNELRNAPLCREGSVFVCSIPEELGAITGIESRRGKVLVSTDSGQSMIVPHGPPQHS